MTATRITVVVATSNPNKVRELRTIFRELPVDLVAMKDVLPAPLHVVEDGATFEANALKKGTAVALATTMLTIADDSGLEVDALGGRPGVRSARFAHEKATDAENNAALLTALSEVEGAARTARFRCVLVLVDPWAPPGSAPVVAEGTCEGSIAREGRGSGGFGYDPLFLVAECDGRAMAELGDEEKNVVSHRGRAAMNLLPALRRVVIAGLDDVTRVSQRTPSIFVPRE